jgi:hypothetical protein
MMSNKRLTVMRRAVALLAAGLLLAWPGVAQGPAFAAPPDPQDSVQPFYRDVFFIEGSSLRNPDDTTSPDESLFNVAGVPLGLTVGQWAGATATSTAHLTGKVTDVRVQLHGLIPNGVYSVFYLTLEPDSGNPLCPGVERSLPVISKDRTPTPDASSFVADGSGAADYRGTIDGNVLGAQQVYLSIIYHLDGQTWNPLPNKGEYLTQGSNCRSSFGEDAMRQMLIAQKFTS